ncbi:MAG: hypothetical protein KatS3mg102_0540 [Planctomycetota bacterium]|nr:MAG: hypothetical protein KatS3mg102_0540 [Planctomycetota bacterium]
MQAERAADQARAAAAARAHAGETRPVVVLAGEGRGGGHRAVMAALAESFLGLYGAALHLVALPSLVRQGGALLRLVARVPGAERWLERPGAAAVARRWLGGRRLAARLHAHGAHAVVFTHPAAAALGAASLGAPAAGAGRAAAGACPPAFAVCTDPGSWVRRGWAHPALTRVFCATEQARAALLERGLAPEQVVLSGMPVRRAFFARPALDPERVRAGLGLAPARPTMLVVADRQSCRRELAVLQAVLAAAPALQLIYVGRDGGGLRAATRLGRRYPGRLAAVAHTRELELLLAASELLLAPPGGTLIFEAAARGVPVLVLAMRSLPPQREATAQLVEQTGIGCAVREPAALGPALRRALEPPQRAAWQARLAALVHPGSAERVALEVAAALGVRPPLERLVPAAEPGLRHRSGHGS